MTSSREPLVDVIVPTYGEPTYLAETLASVLAQTFTGFRVTVFDNGPGGGAAAAVVREFLGDPRVEYDVTGAVLPQVENWNRCLRATRARYVGMLHDDDRWRPGFLARRVALLEAHPECAFAFAAMHDVDEGGAVVHAYPHRLAEGVHAPHAFVPLFLEECLVGSPTPLVRRSAFEDVGLAWRKGIKNFDWELWLHVAMRHPVGYLHARDSDRRVHGGSMTSASSGWGEEELALLDRWEALVARELPDVHWPARLRRRRRAHGHLIAAFDALERDDAAHARASLRAAVTAHPPAIADPRVPAALLALAGGPPARRALTRARTARVSPHLTTLRRTARDRLLRAARG